VKIDLVEFVRSAAGAGDLPAAGAAELAMVGRSNVGKSSLINALFKRAVARISGTPGKTRLLNLYRVMTRATGEFFLVDLPGYGYARKEGHSEFDRLAAVYFARGMESDRPPIGVLLALDARHPGMESDLKTARWLRDRDFNPLVVVNKIDKVSRNERAKTLERFRQLYGEPVLAVSAVTGEGMEELWKQIVSWVASTTTARRPRRSPPAAMAPPRRGPRRS
jgi:GTP-binding protein